MQWLQASIRFGPSEGTWVRHVGSSMVPALRDGDRLRIEPVAHGTLMLGDIVVARRGPRLVAHRLIALRDGIATTRGDACVQEDAPISQTEIVGRVSRLKRARGARSMARSVKIGISRFRSMIQGGHNE
jgi:hypothetical protein